MRKRKQRQVKVFSIAASLLMTFSLIAPTISSAQAVDRNGQANGKIHQSLFDSKSLAQAKVSNRLLDQFKKDEDVTFLVKFKEKADTTKVAQEARKSADKANLAAQKAELLQRSAVVSELKSVSLESQQDVVAFLEQESAKGNVKDFRTYFIVNGIAVTASKEIAEKIAGFAEVEKILPNETRQLQEATITNEKAPESKLANVEWNVERVNAPQAWAMGIDGTGTVVGSLDSGVQWDHPALKEKYRGYDAATDTADHQFSWYDASNGRAVPYDDHGHGTHVTGTMVGSEPNGSNQVGVAPGAKFISAKVFNAAGSTTDAILLSAAEWMIAPGGRVDMAPDVVNNSWGGGPGLDEWYRDSVRAWRDANIFPEFSAGNTDLFNPGGPGSVAVPANYPESFATGATDINNVIASFSLRGPSPYGEIKPDISAPGVNIRSTVPGSGYEGGWNGTSMSGPAVSGVAALLRQVNASITVDQMEEILMNTAVPLTDSQYPESPNNGYGAGLVNAFDAVSSIMDGLGVVEGQVTKEGVDDEAPTYEHAAPVETYAGMDLGLAVSVSDNVSITNVALNYLDANGDWQAIAAKQTSGNFKAGEFAVTVAGDEITGDSFVYKWVINDFGNNEVTSEEYTVEVKPGITTGYFEDFENTPVGWYDFGANSTWEWGVPTSGPGSAFSGEKVYATNLSGDYLSSMNAILVMPPIDLPEGDAFLQFKNWHNFEESSAGRAWDYGHVVVSTDQEEWTELDMFQGQSAGWLNTEVDLSAYSGQRVYVGFKAFSDGSVVREGWYIDDVALSDTSQYSNDSEPPTFEHEAPLAVYAGMAVTLNIHVEDNLRIANVALQYEDATGNWQEIAAVQESGSFTSADFTTVIPGEDVTGESLSYKWVVSDYGNNEVQSEVYNVLVEPGITVGYSQDFENDAKGWSSFGANDSWAWGVPTSGPEAAASGEKVYATNLAGDYDSNMNATLVMPAIDLPDGGAILQFKNWHNFEQSTAGTAWDYGHVVVSTDLEEWTQLQKFQGQSDGWETVEIDLSAYSGRVYVGFNAYSDGSVVREGWYIDDVMLLQSNGNGTDAKKEAKDSKASIGLGVTANKAVVQTEVMKAPANQLEKDSVSAEKAVVNPTSLPLGAKVSVLESGRSVNTNPADGSYSLMHAAGTFTVQAGAYGFHTAQQTVTIESDGTAVANFTLEELAKATVSGTITSEATGEGIAGATVLLVEDANITPVETDEDGNYSLTAYEGTYTMKIIAKGFHGQEVEVTLDGNVDLNIELEPFFAIPGGEIGYDDGTAENARAFYDAGNGWAVKMSLPEGKDSAIVTDGVFRFWDTEWPVPGGTAFAVEVWDASGAGGLPGKKLAGPIDATALRNGEWTVVDLSEHGIVVDGDFYMVYIQTHPNPNTPGLGTDESSPNAGRSYQLVGGAWSTSPADEGNYMIRARVSYAVDKPVITSPGEDFMTNQADITVEGTASPTTTIKLLNNGEEVDSAVVGDDGKFTFPTQLTEGENVFKAVSLINGAPTGESEAVTITLDTLAPDLTIDSPKQGDKTNRETVTVEGTVQDTNLAYVEVNGQKATISNGKYSKRILLDNGENVIEVVAADEAGNTTTKSVTIQVKYDAPEIENLTPTEDKNLKAGESVKIEFDSEAGLRATYVIHMPLTNLSGAMANATELPMMETSPGHYVGYWTATSNAKADGARIEVKVRDDFGNETRKVANGKLFINIE